MEGDEFCQDVAYGQREAYPEVFAVYAAVHFEGGREGFFVPVYAYRTRYEGVVAGEGRIFVVDFSGDVDFVLLVELVYPAGFPRAYGLGHFEFDWHEFCKCENRAARQTAAVGDCQSVCCAAYELRVVAEYVEPEFVVLGFVDGDVEAQLEALEYRRVVVVLEVVERRLHCSVRLQVYSVDGVEFEISVGAEAFVFDECERSGVDFRTHKHGLGDVCEVVGETYI